jgi:DNA repair protein RecO (recombination protein O)
MTNRIITQGIILNRTDFEEAARIITFLTPDHGKVRAIAKGVRKPKSKLAGGIELFSVSDLTLLVGRGEINTLMSTRLVRHYGGIVKNLERTSLAYDFIKLMDKSTAEHPEKDYFTLLDEAFAALDDAAIDPTLTKLWFSAQLMRLGGHTPNLRTDAAGHKLLAGKTYHFNIDSMGYELGRAPGNSYKSDDIKFLRLLFSHNNPKTLQKIDNLEKLLPSAEHIITPIAQSFLIS